MITKLVKLGVIGALGLGLAGGLLFGRDAVSYVRSTAKSLRTAVKDSVPIEFELKRASDLLDEIIPEMHANIRLIAQEEVEVAALKAEITKNQQSLEDERTKIKTLRTSLEKPQVSYAFGGRQYSREDVKTDLAARFERVKESELVLTSKERLLDSREKSLQAAMQLLDKTKTQKRLLEDKIQTLTAQYRLVKASAAGSRIQVDNSKLAQTEKLIDQIQKRLDVAERVLAHESRFVEAIPVDTVVEADLVAQVDDYLQNHQAASNCDTTSVAMASNQPAGQ
jgi:DNA repair exonuclease SbcCD ATPase subunit